MDARAGAAAAEARPSPVTDRATVVPCKSVEGWVVFVSGVHEEAADDDLIDLFGEHGQVLGVTVSLDRETGLSKVSPVDCAPRMRPGRRLRRPGCAGQLEAARRKAPLSASLLSTSRARQQSPPACAAPRHFHDAGVRLG